MDGKVRASCTVPLRIREYDRLMIGCQDRNCGTDGLMVGVGLHQRSALSSFLFAVLMERLTDEVRRLLYT